MAQSRGSAQATHAALTGLRHLAASDLTRHMPPMDEETKATILAVIERAPQWIRHDLPAKDSAARARAEETLAAMIADALNKAQRATE